MGGKVLTQAPALDPVSLAEARAHCRITEPDEDGLLAGYLLAARQYVERDTGRVLITQRWCYTLDRGWPSAWDGACYRTRIVLPITPLQSVVSIQYVDVDGATQTLAANQYRVIKERLFGYVEPAFGVSWPAVRDQSDAITVMVDAGYGTNPGDVPEPIRQAMLLMIANWHENREAVITGTIVAEMPLGVEALLFPYRVFY